MRTFVYSVSLSLLMCICASDTSAMTRESTTIYQDTYVKFRYPANLYKTISRADANVNGAKLRSYNLKRWNGDVSDVITICNAAVSACANANNQTSPYWIDSDTKRLALYDATATVTHIQIKNEDVYEAFPLCPAIDETGKSNSYGAYCYAAIKSNGKNTVSLTYWLASNAGDLTGRPKLGSVKRARQVLDSISKPK
jgi:hypothetical protein